MGALSGREPAAPTLRVGIERFQWFAAPSASHCNCQLGGEVRVNPVRTSRVKERANGRLAGLSRADGTARTLPRSSFKLRRSPMGARVVGSYLQPSACLGALIAPRPQEAPVMISEKQYLKSADLARNCLFFLIERAALDGGAFAADGPNFATGF